MSPKDVYERLCDSFSLQTGQVPDRENLITALRQTISVQDATFYFLLPIFGELSEEKLRRKAQRKGYSPEEIDGYIEKLLQESFIERHYREDGNTFSRVFCAFVAENQVRKKKGTALGKRYAKYWMDLAEVSTYNLPTSTPYARVLAVEETLPKTGERERIAVNESIEDPRETVPYDFVTSMLQNTERIALAECYCRLSKEMAGQPCKNEKETCFLFNEAARSLIEIGVAREVTVEEALEIVKRCEQAGLVHNISNVRGEPTFLCNCCPCCCPILGAMKKGLTNVGSPSRYVAQRQEKICEQCGACVDVCHVNAITWEDDQLVFDSGCCIGCGLCASHCPNGAIEMVLRDEPPKIHETAQKLDARIQREAILGKVKTLIFGKS